LPRDFEIRRTCAEVVQQPGERQRGIALPGGLRVDPDPAGAELAVERRQEVGLRDADLSGLDAYVRPRLAGTRVATQREIDDFENAMAGLGRQRLTGQGGASQCRARRGEAACGEGIAGFEGRQFGASAASSVAMARRRKVRVRLARCARAGSEADRGVV
jgi:hypothetical protein